ncbi:hypothetical protein TNCV_2381771 [Trichonephila clavipes]|nr:hypothetical protein TNCV_2381771 [Trichonephila clavipes]
MVRRVGRSIAAMYKSKVVHTYSKQIKNGETSHIDIKLLDVLASSKQKDVRECPTNHHGTRSSVDSVGYWNA